MQNKKNNIVSTKEKIQENNIEYGSNKIANTSKITAIAVTTKFNKYGKNLLMRPKIIL